MCTGLACRSRDLKCWWLFSCPRAPRTAATCTFLKLTTITPTKHHYTSYDDCRTERIIRVYVDEQGTHGHYMYGDRLSGRTELRRTLACIRRRCCNRANKLTLTQAVQSPSHCSHDNYRARVPLLPTAPSPRGIGYRVSLAACGSISPNAVSRGNSGSGLIFAFCAFVCPSSRHTLCPCWICTCRPTSSNAGPR